jgi:hypothetical protein
LCQFAFDDMEIGSADAAGANAQKDLAKRREGLRNLFDLQWAVRDFLR